MFGQLTPLTTRATGSPDQFFYKQPRPSSCPALPPPPPHTPSIAPPDPHAQPQPPPSPPLPSQDIVTIVWSVAKLRHIPSWTWAERMLQCFNRSQHNCRVHKHMPRTYANMVRYSPHATALMHRHMPRMYANMVRYGPCATALDHDSTCDTSSFMQFIMVCYSPHARAHTTHHRGMLQTSCTSMGTSDVHCSCVFNDN